MQHLLTDVPPHTHTHTHLCVCVCVLAIVLIPCLQLISHDFIHVYSKKKLFNAFKCKQNAHSHSHSLTLTLTLTLPLTLTQSATFTYLCTVTHPYIYSRTQLIHSVALGCLFISFPHSLIPHSIFPSCLACFFFFLPLHICLNDLIFIFPMLADLFVLVMDMRLLKSLPPFGRGSRDIREIS